MKTTRLFASLAWVALWAGASHAATLSLEASDNATVQPGGPRTGGSGKTFFNIEGSNNTTFASFGVADFTFGPSAAGGPATAIASATLTLTQSNSGFSMPATLGVYLASNTASNIIQPGDASAVKYQGANNGLASVDPALGTLTLLGTGSFTPVSNGTVDSTSLSFTGPALTTLLSALNSGGVVRLVIAGEEASAAATYAGFSNNTFAGPTLALDVVVPEPASVTLIVLGGLFAAAAARRRSM